MSQRPERHVDALLVVRARQGSSDAFRRLVERWQGPLLRHARRLCRADDQARDVAQDTWMVVAGRLAQLDDATAFGPWVLGIATRRAADRFRRDARELVARSESEAPRQPDPEPNSPVAMLRDALATMDADERLILSLHHVEDFRVDEIAHALGIPTGTAKSRLHRARQRLKAILERSLS